MQNSDFQRSDTLCSMFFDAQRKRLLATGAFTITGNKAGSVLAKHSMKQIFKFSSIVLSVCIAGLGIHFFYKQIRIRQFITRPLADINLKEKIKPQTSPVKISNTMLPVTPAELPLTLWGTIIGPLSSYAVIEDHQTDSQALYKPGNIIQNAVIKEIFKDSIILRYNNQDYLLKNDLLNTLKPESITKNNKTNSRNIQIKQSAVHALLNKSEDLKRQISIKPILNQDQTNGLLAYRILPDSIFYNLGLRNGDIIKALNGIGLTSIKDAVDIYTKTNPAEPLKLLLLRNGEQLELIYHITPDKDSGEKRRDI